MRRKHKFHICYYFTLSEDILIVRGILLYVL